MGLLSGMRKFGIGVVSGRVVEGRDAGKKGV